MSCDYGKLTFGAIFCFLFAFGFVLQQAKERDRKEISNHFFNVSAKKILGAERVGYKRQSRALKNFPAQILKREIGERERVGEI